jgi:hypothetical protein
LELDSNTINSNQEEEVPMVRVDVIIEELVEMFKDAAREALYKALTFYISAYVNLIFGWGVFKAYFLFIKILISDSPIGLST